MIYVYRDGLSRLFYFSYSYFCQIIKCDSAHAFYRMCTTTRPPDGGQGKKTYHY